MLAAHRNVIDGTGTISVSLAHRSRHVVVSEDVFVLVRRVVARRILIDARVGLDENTVAGDIPGDVGSVGVKICGVGSLEHVVHIASLRKTDTLR